MEFERTKNAKRNLRWSWINKILTLLVPFAMRTIILYTLGNLYLGLGSLFSSILQVLNLAELGVGAALAFAMYKPAAEDNVEELKVLLNLYKKTYLVIGLVVAVAGLILMPFLQYFINGDVPEGVNLYVLYAIYLATTVSSYLFFAYKGSILTVYQRADISEKIHIVINLCKYGIQIAVLFAFKSYYAYVITNLVTTIASNCLVAIAVSKLYPGLKPEGKASKELTRYIFKKTGAVMGHKVAGTVINSIDNILVSAILGLTVVAQYNNYYYILSAISGFLGIISSSLTPIVGNYLIKESKEQNYKLFEVLHYSMTLLICICCCCFISMYQPFITLWVGEENKMPYLIVVLLVMLFFSQKYRSIILLFKDAAGLWEKDLPKPWIQVVVDLIIDICLLNTIGIYGAIISSIVAEFFVAFFYESFVVHKYCFETSQRKFLLATAFYMAIITGSCFVTYYATSVVNFVSPILSLFIYLLISVAIGAIAFLFATCWTNEFKISLSFIKGKLPHKSRGG